MKRIPLLILSACLAACALPPSPILPAPDATQARIDLLQAWYDEQDELAAIGADADDIAAVKAEYQAKWNKITN